MMLAREAKDWKVSFPMLPVIIYILTFNRAKITTPFSV